MTSNDLAPDASPAALLLLDVINDLEWEDAELLAPHFEEMTPHLAELIGRARAVGVPVIYVNDNYGRWRSDMHSLVAHCLDDDVRGRRIVEHLQPGPDDYFVLKPKHSGFFSTALELLLNYLGARTLIITGVAGNICVLFTVNDAHMRDYRIVVPRDCIASNTRQLNDFALQQISEVLGADTTPASELDLDRLLAAARAEDPTARRGKHEPAD